MIRWNIIRLAATGQRVIYEYQQKWGKVYYSFDDWRTQATTKAKAYEIADRTALRALGDEDAVASSALPAGHA